MIDVFLVGVMVGCCLGLLVSVRTIINMDTEPGPERKEAWGVFWRAANPLGFLFKQKD